MRKRTKKIEAVQILMNVPEHQVFWGCNGAVIRNLNDLAFNLEKFSDQQYQHHANHSKNDFSNWLQEVVKDSILAKDLVRARNKVSAVKKVKDRIDKLQGML